MSKNNGRLMKSFAEAENTIWSFTQRLFDIPHKLKTRFWYQFFFGALGRGTVIRNPLLVSNPKYIWIGALTSVRDGGRLEVVKLPGRIPELRIGNRVMIEQHCHIACCNRIVIEDDVAIAARCSIVDIRHPHPQSVNGGNVGSQIVLTDDTVRIGKGAFLGVGVTVLPGVTIGEGAVIGAHSVVSRNIPAYALAVGCPAKPIS